MDEFVEDGNAFAVPHFWKSSSFPPFPPFPQITGDLRNEGWDALNCDVDLDHNDCSDETHIINLFQCLDLNLPELSSFSYGPLQTQEAPALSLTESISGSTGQEKSSAEEDPWSIAQLTVVHEKPLDLTSWEKFYDPTFKEPRTIYLSEAGPRALDATLILHKQGTDTSVYTSNGRLVKSGPMLMGLASLALGRESRLFQYAESDQTFLQRIEHGRMSGYTPESFASLIATFIGHGNRVRSIYRFVNDVYSSNKSWPTLNSLANSLSTIMSTLESQFGDLSVSILGVLQLQSLFHGPGLILDCLCQIISSIKTAQCDEDFLSKLYNFVQNFEHTNVGLQPIMFEILAHASSPWLESVAEWLGLNNLLAAGGWEHRHNFILERNVSQKSQIGKEIQELQYNFIPDVMPTFICEEDAEAIFETGRGLRLLRVHRPEHPLVKPQFLQIAAAEGNPSLEWRFLWQDIEKTKSQAKLYKSRLVAAIRRFHDSTFSQEPSNADAKALEQVYIELSPFASETLQPGIINVAEIEKPIYEAVPENMDVLSQVVKRCSISSYGTVKADNSIFAPPLSLVPLLSFSPIISTQACLVNQACLRLLFKEHSLRMHLSLQHRYHLFGDGVFATRLSHALFDPELQTAERRKGHSRSGVSGLKLGSRETWPPASSELRLALMGILSDSYHYGDQPNAAASFRTELPGGLSFAIREMPEDDFKRCMDPDSIEALDFLRLQYRPPSPIDAVITPTSLAKYDLLFKLLLRGTRMLFIVNLLSRDSIHSLVGHGHSNTIIRRFKLEACHFVTAICSYFFDGVRSNWGVFSRKVDDVEQRLNDYELGEHEGLHHLRDSHEHVLDRMLFALLLRQRQAQVMKLLEEIFSTILIFARWSRSEVADGADRDTKIKDVYERFRRKVKVFVNVCRGLSERRGPGGSNDYELDREQGQFEKQDVNEDRGNTLGQLLLKLEMSGYYAKREK